MELWTIPNLYAALTNSRTKRGWKRKKPHTSRKRSASEPSQTYIGKLRSVFSGVALTAEERLVWFLPEKCLFWFKERRLKLSVEICWLEWVYHRLADFSKCEVAVNWFAFRRMFTVMICHWSIKHEIIYGIACHS